MLGSSLGNGAASNRRVFHESARKPVMDLGSDPKDPSDSQSHSNFEDQVCHPIGAPFKNGELVIGLIGAVGTDLGRVREALGDWLSHVSYEVHQIRITSDVIPLVVPGCEKRYDNEYDRIWSFMDAGNEARQNSNNNGILAYGAANMISAGRDKEGNDSLKPKQRQAYIISSLKHPNEVEHLREIYPQGFYLIGVDCDQDRRLRHLTEKKHIGQEKAKLLMERDTDEHLDYGQQVARTFHLSDFFVRIDGQEDQLNNSLWRILRLMFSDPFITPTFDEYAMFLAFAASLRSADLSRQVGAVVTMGRQILATGANDCPKPGGGLYWPEFNDQTQRFEDVEGGRDFTLKKDQNRIEQQRIIEEILQKAEDKGLDRGKLLEVLESSGIRDLTEFGRVVHAEMEALLSCARARTSTRGGTIYTTTFPCHNCAKHIIAAGILRVVFIEPYRKSKAIEFHKDAIELLPGSVQEGQAKEEDLVRFQSFVGVGPRRFFDLFSVQLGSGYPLRRKNEDGSTVEWDAPKSQLRLQMLPISYLDLELLASEKFKQFYDQRKE